MPRPRTTHLRSDSDAAFTLCGLRIDGFGAAGLDVLDALLDAKKPCRDCARIDSQRPAPFVRSTPAPARYGQRKIDASGQHAIAHVRHAHEAPPHRWHHPERAVQEFLHWRESDRIFGVSLRSSAEVRDRVQLARDPSLGGREHARAERYRTVSLALDLALTMPLEISRACPTVAPDDARWVYELAVAGRIEMMCSTHRIIDRESKRPKPWPTAQCVASCESHRYPMWSPLHHDRVADIAQTRRALRVDEWQVTLIRRFFTAVVREMLRQSGELGDREEQGQWLAAQRAKEAQA